MKRKKAYLPWVLILLFPFLIYSGQPKRAIYPKLKDDLAELKREIHLLNLINGLELTYEQMKFIKENAEENLRIQESVKRRIEPEEKELRSILDEIKNYLKNGKEIPEKVKRQYHNLQTEIKKEIMKANNKIGNLALRVEDILEEHQKYQLKNFVPCIILPPGEVRIGQANDLTGAVRQLEVIRNIPERFYNRNKDFILERITEKIKFHLFPWGKLDEDEIKNHISKVINKVRSLSDTDFQLMKNDLAKEFIAPFKPEMGDVTSKIKFFLISPDIIPIIEEKLNSDSD